MRLHDWVLVTCLYLLSASAGAVIPECEELPKFDKNICYLSNAEITADCRHIEDFGLAEKCYQKIAAQTLYIEECRELPEELQELCIGRVQYNKHKGSLYACADAPEAYRAPCFIYGVMQEGDGVAPTLCEKAPEQYRDACYRGQIQYLTSVDKEDCKPFPKTYTMACIRKVNENWGIKTKGIPLPDVVYRLYAFMMNILQLLAGGRGYLPWVGLGIIVLLFLVVLARKIPEMVAK